MWTLARTLSVLRGGKRAFARRSPTMSPLDTPPSSADGLGQGQHKSILIPANQKALASRGFYAQHGWPQGMFEEEKPVPEDTCDPDDPSQNAASRRKMFQKTRSRRNWSLCGSGDDENKKTGSGSGEWVTKSMDDSLNREDSTGADDTHGRLAYFSTTTESSTDSLDDGKSFETEKALEEIRRQYNEGQQRGGGQKTDGPRTERLSSEDLFVPNPNARVRICDVNDSGLHADDCGDFLNARSNNYFISPATSRQATIEKSPSVCDPSSDGNNNNRNEVEESMDKCEHSSLHSAAKGTHPTQLSRLKAGGNSSSAPASFDRSSADGEDDSATIVNPNVQIIVSGSSLDASGKEFWKKSQSSDASTSRLAVKEDMQRASSDSGSSSSGTAVGSASVGTAGDDLETLRTSESECSVTDRDSISRTNSPCGFLLSAPFAGGARGRNSDARREMVSTGCQASEKDLAEALAQASAAERNGGQNASSIITVKVMKNSNGGTEFVVDGGQKEMDDRIKKEQMRLSTLSPTIDPLELMKRLRRSQEDLPRMGSIQSDSSGFGDAEPGVDADGNLTKAQLMASLGSSMESNGTLASSSATTVLPQSRTEEMATQTAQDTLTAKQMTGKESGSPAKHGGEDEGRYITTCFIPSVTEEGQGGRDEGATWQHDFNSVADRQHALSHRRQTSPSIMSYVSEIKLNVQDGFPGNRRVTDQHQSPDDRSGFSWRQQGRQAHRFSAPGVTPLSRRTSMPYGSSDMVYAQPLHEDRLHNYHSRPQRYLSQCELRVGEEVSPTRNDIPLSEELANARGGSLRGSYSNSSANISSTPSAKSSSATTPDLHQPITSTPASMASDASGGSIRRGSSSITMYINPKEGDSLSSSHSITPRYKTEACFSCQPISGNLSGLTNSARRTTSSVSHSDQFIDRGSWQRRSCDIIEDDADIDFDDEIYPAGFSANAAASLARGESPPVSGHRRLSAKRYSSPAGSLRPDLRFYATQNAQPSNSMPSSTGSRTFDDMEAYSSVGETSSEFSAQSYPEGSLKSGVLDAQRLARLINKPVYYKGKVQRSGPHYRPRRQFREWHALNRKKRLQEENRLIQHSIQKYKNELNVMEEAFMLEYQACYDDLTDEERDEVDELEWVWEEVRLQVSEMERLLLSRAKAVHAGNEFHSFLSGLDVVNKTIELLKEQMYQHHISDRRTEHPEEEYDSDQFFPGSGTVSSHERLTFLPSRSFVDDMMKGGHPHPHAHRSFSHHRHHPPIPHSASMSSLPTNLNVSLEQIKTSLLKEMKDEIKASTQKLEVDLMAKDKEIQALKQRLESEKGGKDQSSTSSESIKPDKEGSSSQHRRSWEPKKEGRAQGRNRGHRRSRSRIMGDRLVTETDV